MNISKSRYCCKSLEKLYDDMMKDQVINSIIFRDNSCGNSGSSSLSDDYVIPLSQMDPCPRFKHDHERATSHLQGSVVYGLMKYYLMQSHVDERTTNSDNVTSNECRVNIVLEVSYFVIS